MNTSHNWIPFSLITPYDLDAHHGLILVTNNLEALDDFGKASHVWLASTLYLPSSSSDVMEVACFTHPGGATLLRDLTHWRPALPEEWPGLDARLRETHPKETDK